jgi:hypothetical protein
MSTVAWEYLSGVGLVRARIPLSAFRVPSGKIAITLSLHGSRCVTAVLDAADIDSWLAKFETGMDIDSADRVDVGAHVQIRELLRQDLAQGEDAEMDACVAAALWLTLNHPFAAETLRKDVAASLRSQDRAQLTISSDARDMWGFVVSSKPAEPDALMAMMPTGTTLCLSFGQEDACPPAH